MTYYIYFDDDSKPFTFTPEVYISLKENLTEIPYNFTEDYDITFDASLHKIYYFTDNFTKVGVQSVYYGGNEKRHSEIAWHLRPSAGIGNVVNTEISDASIVYYDLSGRRIQKPEKGIYIKVLMDDNNKKHAVKVMR